MHIRSILIVASCLTISLAHPGDIDHEAQILLRQTSTLTRLEQQWMPDHQRTMNGNHESTLGGSQRKARRLASRAAAGRGFGKPPNNRPGRKQPEQPDSQEARITRENQKISDLLKDPEFRAKMIPCLELNVFDGTVRLAKMELWSFASKFWGTKLIHCGEYRWWTTRFVFAIGTNVSIS